MTDKTQDKKVEDQAVSYTFQLTETEVKVMAGFLEYAVSKGVPSMTDVFNAFALYQKLTAVLPQNANQDTKGGQ